MADEERTVVITIKAKNLTDAEAKAAAASVLGLDKAIDAATGKAQAGTQSFKEFATQGLAKGGVAADSFGDKLSTAKGLLATFGIGLSVAAVVNFGKALLNDADALVEMSDRLEFSIGALQEMRLVGADTSVSIESMAKSAGILQKNIGNGDAGAVGALKALGLESDALKRMSMEDMYFAVAKSLHDVKDQTELVALGSKLMGKGFIETIPAIKQGFGEVSHDAEANTKAVDAFGDALGRTWQRFKDFMVSEIGVDLRSIGAEINRLTALTYAWSGGLLSASGATDALARAQKNLAAIVPKVADATVDLHDSELELSHAWKDQEEQLKEQTEKRKAAKDATDKLTEANKKFRESVVTATEKMHLGVTELYRYISAIPGAKSGTGELDKSITGLGEHYFGLKQAVVGTMGEIQGTNSIFKQVIDNGIDPLSDRITGHLSQALQRIPQLFIDAFTGGGGVLGALKGIGVSLLNAITQELLQPVWDAVARWAVGIAAKIAGAFAGGGGSWYGGALASLAGAGGGAGVAGGAGAISSETAFGVGGGGIGGSAALAAVPIAGALAMAIPLMISGFRNNSRFSIDNVQGGNGMSIMDNLLAFNAMTPDEVQAQFERNNPDLVGTQNFGSGPESRMRLEGFAGGTHGQYRDFGTGTPVMLHGPEKITPKGEADQPTVQHIYVVLDGDIIDKRTIRVGKGALAGGQWQVPRSSIQQRSR